jgi:hypothetical protein
LGAKPSIAMLEAPNPPAQTLKNCLRVTCIFYASLCCICNGQQNNKSRKTK